ncbi:MAG: ABC transporter ATP-binding protein [Bdellovibrionota bacterium]|nr:MAG: ABC transporter ATP-binding protein [Bdellovibrionota bacterium]
MSMIESANTQSSASVTSGLPAVEVRGVSVHFRSYVERPTSLKETLMNAVRKGRLRYYSSFEALSNVSFCVPRGEVFGIIGSNGAGKSTLLRVIAGVLKPARGEVIVRGRVDSLLQLGAGFDSELNAVENIVLNGSLYKRSSEEMRARTPDILKFAELEEFAFTPIKYYSSGMAARLGFSVAIDRDPDILLVDEVLAVGDERFQKKCRAVFDRYLAQGKTIIMVSHSMGTITSMAKQALVLSKGRALFCGDPKTAAEVYRDKNYETRLASTNGAAAVPHG